MEISAAQFKQIEHCLPRQRGNVSLSNLQVLNAILYVAEHGCKWRGLPSRFGRWHTIYTRMNRWSRNGVLDRVFTELQRAQIIRVRIEAVSLDSTIVKVQPDGTGALKKWTPSHRQIPRRMDNRDSYGCRGSSNSHNVRTVARSSRRCAARACTARTFGAAESAKAYEGNETRQLALDFGFIPVVPPLSTRVEPWEYDREMYKRRNEVERLFRRLKGFRRSFSRFDKLDLMFIAFINFALIVEALR